MKDLDIKTTGITIDEYREIVLGICFGSGLGIIFGTIFGDIMLGLCAEGVLGIIVGIFLHYIRNNKKA